MNFFLRSNLLIFLLFLLFFLFFQQSSTFADERSWKHCHYDIPPDNINCFNCDPGWDNLLENNPCDIDDYDNNQINYGNCRNTFCRDDDTGKYQVFSSQTKGYGPRWPSETFRCASGRNEDIK